MSVFPTKILLAMDGSDESDLAATTAAELAKSTDSERSIWRRSGPTCGR
jgi:nucleotide-binding universal stress UspA family protein